MRPYDDKEAEEYKMVLYRLEMLLPKAILIKKKVKILADLGIRSKKKKIIFLQVRRALQLSSERHPG